MNIIPSSTFYENDCKDDMVAMWPDDVLLTNTVEFSSSLKSPAWKDGYHVGCLILINQTQILIFPFVTIWILIQFSIEIPFRNFIL